MKTLKRKRRRLSPSERREMELEALSRARGSLSFANFPAVITEFAARGIPPSEISPKENVLTYHAWRALGRQVRKGEKGVKVLSWIPNAAKANDEDDGKARKSMRPVTAVVFHVSQTEAQ